MAFPIAAPCHPTRDLVIKVCGNIFERQDQRYSAHLHKHFGADWKILQQLAHPNIMRVLHHFEGDFRPYHARVGETENFRLFYQEKLLRQSTAYIVLEYIPFTLEVFKVGRLCDGKCGRSPTVACSDCRSVFCDACDQSQHRAVATAAHTRVQLLNPLPVRVWLWIMLQLCRAVAYLGDKHIVHRDLKPDNVLVDPTSFAVTVIDFGEALATHDEFGALLYNGGTEQLSRGAGIARSPEVNAQIADGKRRGAQHTLWEIYQQNDVWAVAQLVKSLICEVDLAQPSWFPIEAWRVLCGMHNTDPTARLSASAAVTQLEGLLWNDAEACASDPPSLRQARLCWLHYRGPVHN